MIVFYLLLAIIVLSRVKVKTKGFYDDYLSFDTTNCIKGIFILFVFIKHATPYITNGGYEYSLIFDDLFLFVDSHVGQWIVAVFLFYSGYGIMESIKIKGVQYINSIPKKRILTTLINFDIAVLVYAIIKKSLGEGVCLKQLLLSLIGWQSMGNSNWYIFVIMLAYGVSFITFRFLYKNNRTIAIPCVASLVMLCMTMLSLTYFKESWWYDTMLCFGCGLVYSCYKQQIENILINNYSLVLCLLIVIVAFLYYVPYEYRGIKYNLFSIAFALSIVVLSMKIKVNNAVLMWMGKNLFPLYIYQRVPMIVLSTIGGGILTNTYPVLYVIYSFAVTIIIAISYKNWSVKL